MATAALIVPSAMLLRSAIALSLSLLLGHGTAFRSWWHHQRRFQLSENILRQFCLLAPSRHSNTLSTFYFVTLFYSAVLHVFYYVF